MAITEEGIYYPDDYEKKADIPNDMKKMAESIGTIFAKQNTQIQENQDNYIHIETEQSATINVQDCSNLPAKIDIFGSSEQKMRSGKNKLDIALLAKELTNGISYTFENKKIHVEGTATATTPSSIVNVTDKLEVGKKYILSINKSNSDNVIATASIQYNDGTPQVWVTSFTFSENMQAVNIYLQVANNTTVNVDVAVQLEEGEVATDYEEFGVSPSPIFPSKIENVEGNIDITKCNKNFFNCFKWYKMNNAGGYPIAIPDNNSAIEIIEETKNSIKFNQEVAYCGVLSEYIPVKMGEIFTLSFNYLNINRLYITQYDKTKTRIKELNNTANMNATTFTVEQDGFITIAFSYSSTTPNENTIEITNIQLEAGNIKTDYITNEQQIITFPLEEGQKLYEKSYLADNGIHHKRKQIALDGTETIRIYNWSTPHERTTIFEVGNIISKKSDSIKLCNYFKVVKNTTENLNKDEEYCLSVITGAVWFSVSNEIATTVEQFKNWLAQKKQEGKPLIIEYDLLEEEIEEYTEEQQEAYNQLQNIIPYKLITNISTEKAGLVFKYIADTKTYIDNKYNSLAQKILNLAGGN